MHVFVTGLGGFAGTRLAEILTARGWRVTGLARNNSARLPALPADRFCAVTADAVDLSELPDDLDAVIHAAATMPFGSASMHKLLHDNVLATQRLIELSLRHKVRSFVFFSSTSVFGREHTGVLSDESNVVNPEEYGITKMICERLLADVAGDLPSVALRLPAVLGAGAGRNWPASVAAEILAGKPIKIFNASSAFNNCVHIADVADLAARLIATGIHGSDAAILAGEGMVSIREAVDILMRGLGRTAPVDEVPATRQPFTISAGKAKGIWNWRPMSTTQTLERYAADQRRYAGA